MKDNTKSKEEILEDAKKFFEEVLARNHLKNLNKLTNLHAFNYNPFLLDYLATFLEGEASSLSMAKSLIYPRILGSSITTSFGQNIQKFCSDVLPGYGSAVSGIDLEFTDKVDGRTKYCQIKAGPNTINKDDVTTINNHFVSIRNLARTNNLSLEHGDLIVGVLYGEPNELSANYKKVQADHSVYIGNEFWQRLTGDADFYSDLINAFGDIAKKFSAKEQLDQTIAQLAADIEKNLLSK